MNSIKWSKEDETKLKELYQSKTNRELSLLFNRSVTSIEHKLRRLNLYKDNPVSTFNEEVELFTRRQTNKDLSEHLKTAIEENLILKKKNEIILGVKDNFSISELSKIEPSGSDNEATMIVQWSDWHSDEVIPISQTNGLNKFDPDVFQKRAEQLFKTTVRFINIFRKDIIIKKLIIQLGGDFISGNIHDELKENNSSGIMSACINVTNTIASGLNFIKNSVKDLDIICVCNAGNHSRITHKQMVSTEYDNSLETFMYHILRDRFSDITFLIDDSYFKYLDIYGWTARFHHGHAIRYGGGIGGLFIPAYKKISQWNKGNRVDYDFFGHFHQAKDGGNFICNGSLVGYNAYGIKIGADYEKPKQVACLIDKKRGKTIVAPIILD